MSIRSFPSSAHYEMLLRAQQSLNNVVPLLDAAEACGVDCQEYRQGHTYLADRTNAFLRKFFPDQITPPSPSGLPYGSD